MSEVVPALPVAVELVTADPAAAREFYGALLGWSFEPGPGSDGLTCLADGRPVAGITVGGAGPAAWWTLFGVDDPGAAAARVTAAGGRIDPADPARAADPAGARFGLTRAGSPTPSTVDGAVAWYEYLTGDPGPADAFIRAALGLAPVRPPGATDDTFVLLLAHGRPVGGRLALPPELAGAVPAGWMVYFAVSDVDGVVGRVPDLGGQVVVPPRDAPTGRLSLVVDPGGAAFTILRPAH